MCTVPQPYVVKRPWHMCVVQTHECSNKRGKNDGIIQDCQRNYGNFTRFVCKAFFLSIYSCRSPTFGWLVFRKLQRNKVIQSKKLPSLTWLDWLTRQSCNEQRAKNPVDINPIVLACIYIYILLWEYMVYIQTLVYTYIMPFSVFALSFSEREEH